jgi:hypothetical protein
VLRAVLQTQHGPAPLYIVTVTIPMDSPAHPVYRHCDDIQRAIPCRARLSETGHGPVPNANAPIVSACAPQGSRRRGSLIRTGRLPLRMLISMTSRKPESPGEAVRASAGDLMELKEEYEAWRDNLPDNQRDGILAEKLDETIAAVEAFEEALEAAIAELENADLPRGFGRD